MPTETIYLDADETRLIQVFCNLLNNAAKYSANRGQIAIIASHDGDSVAVKVRDTGFGIPDDVLPRVFDMFTQADKTLEGAKGGLGVGLTLVKRLIELHGGVVEAHSELGKGSEFVVRLPILVDETPAIAPVDQGARPDQPCGSASRPCRRRQSRCRGQHGHDAADPRQRSSDRL
jgi:signal transduction histidine kinase